MFRQGLHAALPVVLGYLGIGFAAGVVERAAGLSYAEILLLSTVLYAGSAQFVLTSMLTLGSPAPAIVLTVFFLNLRHLLLSAALAPALRAVPAWKNALLGLQLTDETFVVASAQAQISPAWMAGLNVAAWSAWAVANLAAGGAFAPAAARMAAGLAALRAARGAFGAARDRARLGRPGRLAGHRRRLCGGVPHAQPARHRGRRRRGVLAPKLKGACPSAAPRA